MLRLFHSPSLFDENLFYTNVKEMVWYLSSSKHSKGGIGKTMK